MQNIQYYGSAQNTPDIYREVSDLIKRRGIPHEEVVAMGEQLASSYKQFDDKYLSALLFPEDSEAARIPSKFPMNTANATQTWSFYLNTGNTGKGYIAVLPLDLSFMCAYQSPQDWDGNPNNSGAQGHKFIPDTTNWPILDYYASGRVVGCSVRVQYIGEAMSESGLVVGSHVFDSTLGRISADIIENGYYITRGRPHEGIRLAYLPRDEGDLDYVDFDYRIGHKTPTNLVVDPSKDYTNNPQVMAGGNLSVQVYQPSTQSFADETGVAQGSSNLTVYFKRPDQLIGQGQRRFQSNYPYQMVINWIGMPPNQNWLRVDIVRHLELVPRLALKDLISVKKCQPMPETIEAVTKIADIDTRPLSNTVERHEQAMAQSSGIDDANSTAILNKGVRLKAGGNWLRKLWGWVRPYLATAAKEVSRDIAWGGPIGAAASVGLGWLGNRLESQTNNNMTGGIQQGLATKKGLI